MKGVHTCIAGTTSATKRVEYALKGTLQYYYEEHVVNILSADVTTNDLGKSRRTLNQLVDKSTL